MSEGPKITYAPMEQEAKKLAGLQTKALIALAEKQQIEIDRLRALVLRLGGDPDD